MPRRPTIVVVTIAVAALLVAAAFLRDYANTIDNLHWIGSPLPPCFLNARACAGHWLGTDEVGRDLLARLAVAAPVSLGISFAAAAVELGLLGAFRLLMRKAGGRMQLAIVRVAEGISCFCAWPLMAVVAMITPYFEERWPLRWGLLVVVAGVLVASRSTPQALREANPWPRLAGRLMRDWAAILLMFATVDFFGLGVQPPVPSWGNMLATFQSNAAIAWWAAVFPAVCLFVAALPMEIGGRALCRPPEVRTCSRNASFGFR